MYEIYPSCIPVDQFCNEFLRCDEGIIGEKKGLGKMLDC